MSFYTDKLYEKVIKEPSSYFDELKIISGYSSASFLNKVADDLAEHKICLIVGMASMGISRKDHEGFKRISIDKANINVYYTFKSPPNHMKIYQWFVKGRPEMAFIGSANFSSAGFFNHKEILSPSIDIFIDIIDETLSNSMSCLNENIESIIPIYDTSDFDTLESEGYVSLDFNNINKTNEKEEKEEDYKNKRVIIEKNNSRFKKMLLNNIKLTRDNNVNLQLILKDDPHWESRGLNNWNRKGKNKEDSYIDIERTNIMGINRIDFFERDTEIKLISDDKEEWIVKRTGQYGRELKVVNGINFYEYFKNRLSIKENRPISYYDLEEYGRPDITLYRLMDGQYFMDYSADIKI